MADLTKLVVETQQSATKLLADGMTAQNACAWDSAFKTSANREIHNSDDLKVTQTSLLKAFDQSSRGQPRANQCPIEEFVAQQAPSLDMQLAVLGDAHQAMAAGKPIGVVCADMFTNGNASYARFVVNTRCTNKDPRPTYDGRFLCCTHSDPKNDVRDVLYVKGNSEGKGARAVRFISSGCEVISLDDHHAVSGRMCVDCGSNTVVKDGPTTGGVHIGAASYFCRKHDREQS
jgi:hypothetical protein